ncbi:MAG TPA: 2TM domain-containing protein [Armatimonadota bacterium]|jgi:hypothetical protein
MKPHYTQEEANEILRRAVERAPMKDEMSREQLEAVAAEIGVSPEALRKAEDDWHAERSDKEERLAYASLKRLGFYKHLAAYVLFTLMIAYVTGAENDPDGMIPTVVIALLWGIGIVCHGLSAFNTTSAQFDAGYTHWRIGRRARELAARELGRLGSKKDL